MVQASLHSTTTRWPCTRTPLTSPLSLAPLRARRSIRSSSSAAASAAAMAVSNLVPACLALRRDRDLVATVYRPSLVGAVPGACVVVQDVEPPHPVLVLMQADVVVTVWAPVVDGSGDGPE